MNIGTTFNLKICFHPCFVPISVDYVPLPSLIQSDLFKCKIKRLWERIICIYYRY